MKRLPLFMSAYCGVCLHVTCSLCNFCDLQNLRKDIHLFPAVTISFAVYHVCVFDSLNTVDWSLLPPPAAEMFSATSGIKGRFQGDPSYEYETPDKKEEGEKSYEEETGVSILGVPFGSCLLTTLMLFV